LRLSDESLPFIYFVIETFADFIHLCSFNSQEIRMKASFIKRVLQHIAFWAFYVLIYTVNYSSNGQYNSEVLVTLQTLPFHLLFTYTQLYLFIPKLLLQRKFFQYGFAAFVFTKFVCWLKLVYNHFQDPVQHPAIPGRTWLGELFAVHISSLKTVFSLLMIFAVALSIKLLKKWYVENDRNHKIQKEKTLMELEMLKAQVHPHFLFNTLNNLYSLVLTNADSAPVVVSNLSDLLRYMLYECNEKEVPLNNEIGALKKYMELEKLRYGNRLDISFSCGGTTDNLVIAPLLLLPFVENSFKHGVSEQLDQCWINLHLHAEGTCFTFNLSNSLSKEAQPVKGGIGLQNIQKRLELIYAGAYTLNISRQEEIYAVKLTIQLSPAEKPAARQAIAFTNALHPAV
jgi:two-component system, LytTR family, sensor kinase